MQQDQAVNEPRIFHGVGGETLAVNQDADVAIIRTRFPTNELSAHETRELAAHLIECAKRAEAWMASAADEPADGWSFLVGPIRALTDTLGAVRLTTNVTNVPEPIRSAIQQLAEEITVWPGGVIGPRTHPDSVTEP